MRGFTLLELLTVMGIIAILAGIVLGVGRRANESGKIARAKVELAALSNALEAYKTQYGDYPQTLNSSVLLQSLIGKVGPNSSSTAINGRALIESAKFSIATAALPDVPVDPFTNPSAVLLDPWDNPYLYAYSTAANGWKNSSFVLFSAGPDGVATLPLPLNGIIDALYDNTQQNGRAINTDNLYANRN